MRQQHGWTHKSVDWKWDHVRCDECGGLMLHFVHTVSKGEDINVCLECARKLTGDNEGPANKESEAREAIRKNFFDQKTWVSSGWVDGAKDLYGIRASVFPHPAAPEQWAYSVDSLRPGIWGLGSAEEAKDAAFRSFQGRVEILEKAHRKQWKHCPYLCRP